MKKFTISRGGSVSVSCVLASVTDTGYFYIPLPDGRGTRRIWVNRGAINIVHKDGHDSYVVADKLDYRITEKGNVVLMPGDKDIAIIHAVCGYRGHSEVKVIRNGKEVEPIVRGSEYHSPAGALGVDDIVIVPLEEGDIIKVERTGRLYGADPELTFVYAGGELAEHVPDEELVNLL